MQINRNKDICRSLHKGIRNLRNRDCRNDNLRNADGPADCQVRYRPGIRAFSPPSWGRQVRPHLHIVTYLGPRRRRTRGRPRRRKTFKKKLLSIKSLI